MEWCWSAPGEYLSRGSPYFFFFFFFCGSVESLVQAVTLLNTKVRLCFPVQCIFGGDLDERRSSVP